MWWGKGGDGEGEGRRVNAIFILTKSQILTTRLNSYKTCGERERGGIKPSLSPAFLTFRLIILKMIINVI